MTRNASAFLAFPFSIDLSIREVTGAAKRTCIVERHKMWRQNLEERPSPSAGEVARTIISSIASRALSIHFAETQTITR